MVANIISSLMLLAGLFGPLVLLQGCGKEGYDKKATNVYSNSKYLADIPGEFLGENMSFKKCELFCHDWASVCPSVCKKEKVCRLSDSTQARIDAKHFSLEDSCKKPCVGFNMHRDGRCTLFDDTVELLKGGTGTFYAAPGSKVAAPEDGTERPPPLSQQFNLWDPSVAKGTDPCASQEDGQRICVKGMATLCKNVYGSVEVWTQERCSTSCEAGRCSGKVRALIDEHHELKPPPLSQAFGLYGETKDPCELHNDGERICKDGRATLCKKRFGKVRSWLQESCLNGCHLSLGYCAEHDSVEKRALIDEHDAQRWAVKPPTLSEAFGIYDGTLQDPCESHHDNERICSDGQSVICKKRYGKVQSWLQNNCQKGCESSSGYCSEHDSVEKRNLIDEQDAQKWPDSLKPPPLSEAFGIYDGTLQDPCEKHQDNERICLGGKSTVCKKRYGKVQSWLQDNCLDGCDSLTGQCAEHKG